MMDEKNIALGLVTFFKNYFIRPALWVSLILLAASILLLATSFYQVKKYTLTSGEVVAMNDNDTDFDGLAPLVVFTDDSGFEREHQSTFYSSPPRFSVGDKVEIFYNPQDPNDAEIKNYNDQFFFPALLLFSSFFLFLFYILFSLFFKTLSKAIETGKLKSIDEQSGK